MTHRALTLFVAAAALAALGLVASAAVAPVTLPSGFRLSPPQAVATVGTMPQGLALSPDGTKLAVVESGVNPAALRILSAADLSTIATIPLKGAFGKPVWQDNATVWVAGGNTDSVIAVDVPGAKVAREIPIGKGTWPCAIASPPQDSTLQGLLTVANDGDGSVSQINLISGNVAAHLPVGAHPSDVAVARNGTVYVAVRSTSKVAVVRDGAIATWITVGKHPAALGLDNNHARLYVANSDDDSLTRIDTGRNVVLATISLRLGANRVHGYGSLPNGITIANGNAYVSLGGANAIAVVLQEGNRVSGMAPVGWYPTGVATAGDGIIFVSDGKGERAPPNPLYNPFTHAHREQYVAAQTLGSVRRMNLNDISDAQARVLAGGNAAPLWRAPAQTVLRAHGPISHVIYIIKENRSYDQVLGDISGANGDPSVVWFGRAITPNQHALAQRFGVFDNAYANAQISADGHNWTDAAIANDYVERYWPVVYGDRRSLYDFQSGDAPDVPHSGYLWDAARRAGITYRDYGENINAPDKGPGPLFTTFPNLAGHFDPRFVGWNLRISDTDRYAEWLREFRNFERGGKLPALEIVFFPNDHTSGTATGAWTPQAYVATNDLVVGKLVDAVSHSRYWKSTAILVLEDDAQNGPDHVSDQRSTFYIASPYARGGIQHRHYSTASFVHTIELILGLQPLSLYDTTAEPLYAAFGMTANQRPYTALVPQVDMNARNAKTAYRARDSARMNWRRPDAVNPTTLNDILAHAVRRN